MNLLFVCQGNTCRSPIAEGLVRTYGGDLLHAVSAGIRPGAHLAEPTRLVMEEIGIEMTGHQPLSLEEVGVPVDYVISLCDVIAPGQDLFPGATRMWWRIPDPIGGTLDDYRATRDRIWSLLRPLIERLTENKELPERFSDLHSEPTESSHR